jgi:hypothetical protein
MRVHSIDDYGGGCGHRIVFVAILAVLASN